MGVQTPNKEKNLHFCLLFFMSDTQRHRNNKHFLFSQNIILFRETGLKGGVTATAKLPKQTEPTRSPAQGLIRDWAAGWRRRYQPVHPFLSPPAPGRTANAASS